MCSNLGRILAPKSTLTRTLQTTNRQKNFHTVPVKEIIIPTQWGHVAGKLWGNDSQRPILALHGWQDNAGTWDTLAPILSSGRPLLAIDLPGHGLSSWIPPGMQYNVSDLLHLIMYIKEFFQWNKLTILSHSMGGVASMDFATIFPNDVDGFIAFDAMIGDGTRPKFTVRRMQSLLQKMMVEQTRLNKEPPPQTYEDLKETWCTGTKYSVDMETVDYLMKRGSRPSKEHPERYVFTRDPRLKYILFPEDCRDFVRSMSRRLACPTLYFKGENSEFGASPLAVEIREQLMRTNDKFEMYIVPGTHHLHLNTPELVAPYIIDFLRKYDLFDENEMAKRSKI